MNSVMIEHFQFLCQENIDAVHELMKQDSHAKYHEIEGISMTRINKILHECLAVKKIFLHWIPSNLTNTQKEARVGRYKELLRKCVEGSLKTASTQA